MVIQEAAVVMLVTIGIGLMIFSLPIDILPNLKPKTFGYFFWNIISIIGLIFIFAPIIILILCFLKFWFGIFFEALATLF